MKKLLLLLLMSTVFTGVCFAWNREKESGISTDNLFASCGDGNSIHGFFHSSQTDQYFGVRIGPAFTRLSSDGTNIIKGKGQTGLNIGLAYGRGLSYTTPIFVETGLYYSERGGKQSDGNVTYDLNYLSIPVVLKYIWTYEGDFSVQPFAGGYAGYGIYGKIRDYEKKEAYNSFSSDSNAFKHLDAGLKFGCGVGYNIFYFEFAYELGLVDIKHDLFSSARNRAIILNVGVNL